HDDSALLAKRLQDSWDLQRAQALNSNNKSPSLTRAIYSAHKFEFWLAGF
ncbi:hypothetical protein TrST_g5110, partial [Triparma strigata]